MPAATTNSHDIDLAAVEELPPESRVLPDGEPHHRGLVVTHDAIEQLL